MTFNDEIRRWDAMMEHQFKMSRIYAERGNQVRSDEARERAMLIGEFIKTLDNLKWDYT